MGTAESGQWSIGELARACGVSVRTLHHYDEIGLLSASGRTPSGHRRYGEGDLRRLYRIRALQMLGIPLASITAVLDMSEDDDLASMRVLLDRQLRHVQQHAQQVQTLQIQLGKLLDRLDTPTMPTAEQFMSTLEMITVFEKHFTPEQRQQLADKRQELGAEKIEAAKHQWATLVEEGLELIRAGTSVTDPAVQDWVRSWDGIGEMFHSGEDTKAAAREAWQENSQTISADLPWGADDLARLMAYLQKARAQ
ncbi:MerR family DNA-binding transcriptional regulator [Arthrobacter sp. AK01]|uniref:MerR family DNA-binding transcriptional regulator n=1 Tax=Arthrobacter sp. AK01 TaxID=2894084 RepID=UPI001E2964BF|nr:MerR family DNA-binding transcriptional regulator [Arthrobacter sp. AK01]MCD4852315.1 MerR family DNA-binding transcriptional regulator [Arthrobacter sp. AK01]